MLLVLCAAAMTGCNLHSRTLKFSSEGPDREFLNVLARMEIIDGKYIVYTIERAEYSGGAHGLETTMYANYDLRTGQRVTLDDLFTPEGKARLANEIRRKILEDNNVSSWAELRDKGCWLEESEVVATENFYLTGDAILFQFNPYEVACYANGSTSVWLSYRELKELMKI